MKVTKTRLNFYLNIKFKFSRLSNLKVIDTCKDSFTKSKLQVTYEDNKTNDSLSIDLEKNDSFKSYNHLSYSNLLKFSKIKRQFSFFETFPIKFLNSSPSKNPCKTNSNLNRKIYTSNILKKEISSKVELLKGKLKLFMY